MLVRATGGSAPVTLIIAVTKASPPHHICHRPLIPESVGGRGRMEGGLKWKEEKEGKGRREGEMVVNGHPHAAIWEVV